MKLLNFPWSYYEIVTWVVVKLFRVYVAHDNYDDFQHVNFIFLTKFHFKIYFEDYFNDETDLRVMVMHSRVPSRWTITLKDIGYLLIFKKCVKVCRVIKVETTT